MMDTAEPLLKQSTIKQETPLAVVKPKYGFLAYLKKPLFLALVVVALVTLLPACNHSHSHTGDYDYSTNLDKLPPVFFNFEFPPTFPSFEIAASGIGSTNITVSSSPTIQTVIISAKVVSNAQEALDASILTATITPKNTLFLNASFPDNLADVGLYCEISVTFPEHFDLTSVYLDGHIVSLHWTADAPLVLSSFDAAIVLGSVQVSNQLHTGVVGINMGSGSVSFTDALVRESIVIGVDNGDIKGNYKGFESFAAKVLRGEIHAFLSGSEKVDSVLYSLTAQVGVVKAIIGNFKGVYQANVGSGGKLNVGGGDPGSTPSHGTVGGKVGTGVLDANVGVGSIDLLFI